MWLNPKNAEKILAELMKLRKPAPNVTTAHILQDYSKEIRARLTKKSTVGESYVCTPLLNCDALDQVSEAPIIVWLYFNPMGPTYSQLCVVPVPDANEMLLTLYSDHPLDARRAVLGLLPAGDTIEFLKAVRIATAEIALTNGDESCPLFGGLPSTVLHRENWCGSGEPPLLSAHSAKEFFRMYAKESCDGTNLTKSCYYLHRFKGDPWERTAIELEESCKRLGNKHFANRTTRSRQNRSQSIVNSTRGLIWSQTATTCAQNSPTFGMRGRARLNIPTPMFMA